MPGRVPTAPEVQRAVETVYRRPEFAEKEPGFGSWIWGRVASVLQWIFDRIADFGELRQSAPWIFWAVMIWLVATLLVIIGHLVWTAVQAARMGADDPASATADGSPRTRPRTAVDWEAEAARLAAEGRLREAAAALYQALVLRLDARGAVRFDPSKTPGDYRREARKHADASRSLTAFLRLFEPVAFGGRGLDATGWERLKAAAAEGGAGA